MKRNLLFVNGLLFSILFLAPSLSFAQFTDDIDLILYCKDGSIYNGLLLEETDDYYKIEILENHPIVVSKDLVREAKRRDNYLYYRKGRIHKTQGFFFGSHYGFNIPTSIDPDADNYSRQCQILFGYQLNSKFSLGLSVGLAVSDIIVTGIWATKGFLTPSVYGRYYLGDGGIRPFAYSEMGYGFGVAIDDLMPQNGFTTQNGLGIHLASRKRTKFVFSVGHYLQRAKGSELFFDTFNNEVRVDYKQWINRPIFKIGFGVN